MSLIKELNRRNVFRVGVAYVIVTWLLLQVADVILPTFRTPEWVMQAFTFLLILGFPMALIFAWAFELTPEGLKKENDIERSESITHVTGRKLDFVIIGLLVVALGYFGYDKFVLDPDRDAVEIKAAVQVAQEQINSAVEPKDSAKSIAVLAFADLSPEGNQAYFCDGISEEILNLLVKVPELRVTSRSSAFSFKGQKLDVPTMAARLNVAYVLEGSVRKSGSQLRITAQLVEGVTDTHLWSETYDRELKSVFAIQDEIAASVVEALKITLLGKELKSTETDPEVYALYLRGRYLRSQHAIDSYEQAETLLKQALEIDPGYAPAWSELGNVYNDQTNRFNLRPVGEAHKLARDAIQHALDIDPQYGRAWADLGDLEIHYGWNFTAADQYMQRALALNPGDTFILDNVAHLDDVLGRIDQAIDLYRQSIALNPLSTVAHNGLGKMNYRAHRLEEAADSFQLALSLNPGQQVVQYRLGMVRLAQGDAPAALAAMEKITLDYLRLTGMAKIQHALGDVGASDAALLELIENWNADAAYTVAMVYAFRDEIDLAFDWLDRAYNNRDTGLAFMLLEPVLANLHDDPRWTDFLEKMGLPQ